jgi:hypothetical protein
MTASDINLIEHVARRMLDEIIEQGGEDGDIARDIDDFCEKLQSHPEKYLSVLATGAIDCVSLSNCLHPRVTYFQCPINDPNCTKNCGNYGFGN